MVKFVSELDKSQVRVSSRLLALVINVAVGYYRLYSKGLILARNTVYLRMTNEDDFPSRTWPL